MRAIPLCLLFALACSAPQRDYTPEQIAAETELDKLMHVQATIADPRFAQAKSLDAGKMTENDFELFIDMGRRLRVSAKRIGEISKTDFGGLDKRLGKEAAALEDFAQAGDGANTLKTTRAIKKTCAACHSQYR